MRIFNKDGRNFRVSGTSFVDPHYFTTICWLDNGGFEKFYHTDLEKLMDEQHPSPQSIERKRIEEEEAAKKKAEEDAKNGILTEEAKPEPVKVVKKRKASIKTDSKLAPDLFS